MPAETHSHGRSLEPEELRALVLDRVTEVLGGDPEALALDASLRDDLGADDLTLLDLVELLEDELAERTVGFRLDDDDLGEIETVGDLVDLVFAALGAPDRADDTDDTDGTATPGTTTPDAERP